MKLKTLAAGIVALLIIIVIVPALVPDEDYLPEVRQWLDDANKPQNLPQGRNAFFALAGFNMTGQPEAIAGATLRIPRISGKFQGAIAPTTPIGCFNTQCLLPGI